MVNKIYPAELQLNKANTSDTEAPFLDLHLSISNDFDILNFSFWMAIFHVVSLMECIFLNSYDLQECVVMKKILMLVINA